MKSKARAFDGTINDDGAPSAREREGKEASDSVMVAAVAFVYNPSMRRGPSVLSSVISLAISAVIVAFFVHLVTTDTIALRRLADEEICIGQRSACNPTYSLLERNALGVSIDYETPFHRVAQCRRRYVVLGDYACAVVAPVVGPEPARPSDSARPKDGKSKPNGPALLP